MRSSSPLACAALGCLLLFSCSSESSSGTDPGADGGGGTDSPTGPDGSGGEGGGGEEKPPPVTTTTTETFTFGEAERKYVLSVPIDYDANRAYPLVMELHGNPGTAEFMLSTYPFEGVSQKDGIVVYPNALGRDWDLFTATDTNPDMRYLEAVVDEVAGKYNIDRGRVFGTGWSGGGFMLSQYVCRLPGLFKAVAINAGGAPAEEDTPCQAGQTAVLVTHGETDGVVVVGSGTWAAQFWATHNGCGGSQSDTTPSPCKAYDGCPANAPVHVCIVPGQGHPQWSEAHAAAWAFFNALP